MLVLQFLNVESGAKSLYLLASTTTISVSTEEGGLISDSLHNVAP